MRRRESINFFGSVVAVKWPLSARAQLLGPSGQAMIRQRLSVILHWPATFSFNFPHPYLVADPRPNSGERSSQQEDDGQADRDGEELEKDHKEHHF